MNRTTVGNRARLVACLMLVVAAACSKGSSNTSTYTPIARPSSTAQLTLVSPTNGEVIHGASVHLQITLTGARIVPATTRHIVPDQGHLHVYLDNHIVSMNFSTSASIAVTSGTHFVRVEFVASDHLPFDPDVVTPNVTFLVQP